MQKVFVSIIKHYITLRNWMTDNNERGGFGKIFRNLFSSRILTSQPENSNAYSISISKSS